MNELKNWEEFEQYLVTTRYSVRDPENGTPIEKNWKDITTRIEKALRSNPGILDPQILDKIINAIKNRYIIPASPFLMTFGNPYTQRKGYFSCYPLGYVGDSMREIYDTCDLMMQIYIRGGGVGIDISKLRPKNSPVDQKQGISSGPVGFLQLFDAVTATTNQGGRRRGALLVQMHWKHPDITKFIKAKAIVPHLSKVIYQFPEEDRIDVPLQNMNISVVVDDEFWEKGQELFDLIAENAWRSGDPGLLFLSNMRKFSPFNPKEYGDEHDPTFSNPCGEYLAPAFTACNLITINVAKIAKESLISEKEFDFEKFYKNVSYYAQLASFLGSYLVELDEGYPTEVIRRKTQEVRPVGVGMTGFHTALLLAYDGHVIYGKDKKAIEFAENTQASLTIGTLTASSKLTKQTKKFYKWNPEYLWLHLEELKEVVEKRDLPLENEMELIVSTANGFGGFYNAITTSQPPTGSVSQFARVAGDTGIEPMYAIELQRRVRDFYTNEWKTVTITTEYLIEKLENKDFRKRVEKQLAYALNPEDQLVMLEAFQKFIHTGVSKTINVPQNTTVEQIKELIIRSKNARLKGFTVFREGCRVDTVYISPKEKESKSTKSETIQETELAPTREAFVYEVKGTVNAYVTTTFDKEKRVREVFISVGKAGTTLNGMFQAFGRVISVTLREHPELVYRIINTLEGIETGEFYKCNGITGKSLPDIIAKIIKDALERAKAKNENSFIDCDSSTSGKPLAEALDKEGDLCPVCGRLSVYKNGSCKTCRECGFTTC
ncbi:MAG: hypothetical protein ACP5HC_02020 [Caldisericum sp.]